MPINRTFNRSVSLFEPADGKFNQTPSKHKPRHIESDIQRACVRWFRLQYPALGGLLFAVPNGGSRNAIEAKRLKTEGVVSGVSDMILLVPCHGYHALCIEMKTPERSSRQTDTQKAFQSSVETHGYKYVICRSVSEFAAQIDEYLK